MSCSETQAGNLRAAQGPRPEAVNHPVGPLLACIVDSYEVLLVLLHASGQSEHTDTMRSTVVKVESHPMVYRPR